MTGDNPNKGTSTKPSSSSSASHHRKSATNNPSSAPQKPSPSKPPANSKPSPSSKHKPSPKPNPNPIPSPHPRPENFAPPPFPPPPPAYGFHLLDRRTIILADGTARTYFALPPDYQDFPPPFPRPPMRPHGPDSWLGFDRQLPPGRPIPGADDHFRQENQDFWNSLGVDGSRKRKFGDERDEIVNDEFARQRQQLLQYGNMNSNSNSNGSHMAGPSSRDEMRAPKHMRPDGDHWNLHSRHNEIDQARIKSAFLTFVKVMNDNANQKKKYFADGKQGSFQCLACGRSSKDFQDMHSLIMHTYNPEKATTSEQVSDHLGLHKALCVSLGWNYFMPPDNSKAYQQLSLEEAAAERDDLIIWPPHVIIHNTTTGKGRDGRLEGLGNKAMDMKLRDFGFTTGKPKALYGREGHMGTTVVKFAGDPSGLKDAMRLSDFFERQKHGRRSWASIQPMFRPGKDDEKDPNFVKIDKKTGEKERILYGYIGTVFDLEILEFDIRKKVTIESKRERIAQPAI